VKPNVPAVCRHGVRIDRYCDPCEEGWPNRDEPRHVTAVGAWLAIAAVIAAIVALLAVTRPWEGRA
jgi:hypothetical protein